MNNVGLSYEFPAPFLEIEGGTNEFTSELVKCNITSVNTMTALVLPQVKACVSILNYMFQMVNLHPKQNYTFSYIFKMVERKSGVVINISSLSGLMPTPLLSVYSASKSYVDIFSRGLCEEYKKMGVTVQSVAPGYVVRYEIKLS